MTSIRLLRNANQPSNILSELNRQRKKNQLCEITIVIGAEKLYAHQCVLAACSGYFHKLFTIDKKGASGGELEIPLKSVTFRGMKDVLDYVYGDVIFVSEDSIDGLLRSTVALNVKDLLNDLTKYMMSILDVRNCLHMLATARRCSLTRFCKSVRKFVCENLEAVSVQENFYFFAKSDLEKILSSEDVILDCESHLYEVILKWVKFDPESRLEHFPEFFSKVRLQFVPQEYLLDIIRREELVKEFPACIGAVTEAMYFHLKPEAAIKESARLTIQPEYVDLLLSTGTNLVGYYDEHVKVIQKCQDYPDLTQASFATHGSTAYACGGTRENMTSCLVRQFDGKVWTRLPTMSTERVGTALVCFKGKLLAFGGSLDVQRIKGSFTDKVELLDKTINEWITIGTSPSFRSNSCAVSSEFSVFVLGGLLSCTNGIAKAKCCSVVEIYDPSSNSWTIGPNMTKERCFFSAQSIKQQIFVFGGDASGANTMETFHLLDNAWTMVTTELPIPLRQIFSASHGNSICLADVSADSIKVWRSIIDYRTNIVWRKELEVKRNQTDVSKSIALQQTWRESLDKLYEPDRNEAPSKNAPLRDAAVLVGFKSIYVLRKDSDKIHQFKIRHPNTTYDHHLCYARDGVKLVFCGGSSLVASEMVTQCINEDWTSHSEQWTNLPDLDQPVLQSVVVFVEGLLYIFGGVLPSFKKTKVLTSSLRLNSLKKWEKLCPMPVGKHSSAAVHVKGMIYILGGSTHVESYVLGSLTDVQNASQQKGRSSVDIYSVEKNEWSVGPAMPSGFGGRVCAEVYEDKIFVMNKSNLCNFDVTTKIWTVVCDLPFSDLLITSSICGSNLYIAPVSSPSKDLWRCNLSNDTLKWEKIASSAPYIRLGLLDSPRSILKAKLRK